VAPLPSGEAQAYTTGLTEFERRLLGKAFLETLNGLRADP
jgi:hypothetical protein